MGHLDQVQSIKGYHSLEDILRWAKRKVHVMIEPKVDGVNLTLYVKNGVPTSLLTRGSGKVGLDKLGDFDIFQNLRLKGSGYLKLECY